MIQSPDIEASQGSGSSQVHYLTGTRIVLTDRLLDDASLVIANGQIEAIAPEHGPAGATVHDLRGLLVMPGLVDLHSDAIEGQAEPRPGVHMPLDFAVDQIDRLGASVGITTFYHALSLAGGEIGLRSDEGAREMTHALAAFHRQGLVDNRVHLRYEVTNPDGPRYLDELIDQETCHLISFMDHSPGQGQFQTEQAYREYLQRKYQRTEDQFQEVMAAKRAGALGARERIEAIAAKANAHGIVLASHDDDDSDKLAWYQQIGVRVAEFPVTIEAGLAAKRLGMPTLVGAPNLLRDRSQRTGIRASEAIRAGYVTGICSDYVPAAMLPATLAVHERMGVSLPIAIAMGTSGPARAAGLDDRGELAVGQRADVIAVDLRRDRPAVIRTWVAGRLVFAAHYRE